MRKTTKILFTITSAFLITLILSQITQGQGLQITLATDKQSYNLGEEVVLTGNLTLDGEPASEGLVSIQIDNPCDEHFVIRTIPTGPNITDTWPMEIVAVIPCGPEGVPKYTFQRGEYVGFNITVRNGWVERNVIVTINTYYSDGVSFAAMEFTRITPLHAYETVSVAFPELIKISEGAPLGTATVYANAFDTKWPKDGGFVLCPEKSADFEITTSTASSEGLTANSASTAGNFNITFRIPLINAHLGDYTVYAISFYQFHYLTTSQITFKVVLITDITGDGKVNMKDISMVARAFGAFHVKDPASPKYCEYWHDPPCGTCPHDPKCDLVEDDKINMKDVSRVARDFGKAGIPEC